MNINKIQIFVQFFVPLVLMCSGALIHQHPLSTTKHPVKRLATHEYQNNVVWSN